MQRYHSADKRPQPNLLRLRVYERYPVRCLDSAAASAFTARAVLCWPSAYGETQGSGQDNIAGPTVQDGGHTHVVTLVLGPQV